MSRAWAGVSRQLLVVTVGASVEPYVRLTMAPRPWRAASMNSGVTPIDPHDTTRSRSTCDR